MGRKVDLIEGLKSWVNGVEMDQTNPPTCLAWYEVLVLTLTSPSKGESHKNESAPLWRSKKALIARISSL